MSFSASQLTTLAVAVVFIVLLFGIGNMLRGQSANASQRLMRWRVGLQFLAIVVIIVTVYLMR
ncbi:MAG: twin transmembrane helix small protein [Hyphomicrobiaceae bacterium]